MPIIPTHPGVYIEEVQSSVHTIVGVPTSVAAFVGYSARGVTDMPVQCNSWGDYERAFGGLDPNSPMSYAAFLFFLNGGNVAQVVRAGASDGSAAAARIVLPGDLALVATSPGIWGNTLQVEVDTTNLVTQQLFNRTITDTNPAAPATEQYTGVSLTGPQAASLALAASALMNVDTSSTPTEPTITNIQRQPAMPRIVQSTTEWAKNPTTGTPQKATV